MTGVSSEKAPRKLFSGLRLRAGSVASTMPLAVLRIFYNICKRWSSRRRM
jgi:hypothetical protein